MITGWIVIIFDEMGLQFLLVDGGKPLEMNSLLSYIDLNRQPKFS
jgi:hypothetical protein